MKKTVLVSALAIAMTHTTTGLALADRVTIQGDVAVHNTGTLVETLKGNNPMAEGALHEFISPGTVKSDGITLTGAEETKLAVRNEPDKFNLCIDKGAVDFVFPEPGKDVGFYLPDNTFTSGKLNAGSGNVTGTLTITEKGQAEILVKEGEMAFSTAEGEKVVKGGQKIVIELSNTSGTSVCEEFMLTKIASHLPTVQQTGSAGILGAVGGETALLSGAVVAAVVTTGAVIATDDDDESFTQAEPAPTTSPAANTPNPANNQAQTNPPGNASQGT